MKRFISILGVVGLTFGAIASADAKTTAKPAKSTFYLHGSTTVGEVDLANNFAATYNRMDTAKPTDPTPKSLEFTTWTGNPSLWNDCAGSYLLPVWSGSVSGKIVGNIKVTLNTVAAPRDVTIQVWPDLMTQTCASNDLSDGDYPQPAAQATVTLPPGPGSTTVVLKNPKGFKATTALTMQLLPNGPVPGRVLYDSASFASSVQFSCIPSSGKSCT
ncbi:MAG: hypothetical protein M3290_00390 [Actinomycetota bacterium]|nr:hypothetical protein [Actinomycetota bacterium]